MKFKSSIALSIFATVLLSQAHAARPSFTSLQQQINVLNARINELETVSPIYVVDGSDTRIGPLVSDPYYTYLYVMSSTGYFYYVERPTGDVSDFTLYWSLENCGGQAYAKDESNNAAAQGVVFIGYTASGNKLLVSAKGVDRAVTDYLSFSNSNGCVNTSSSGNVYPVVPNNPAETGLSVTQFQAPITLQHATDANP